MGPTWGPPGSYRPQMGPMLAPWTLLSGTVAAGLLHWQWAASEHSWRIYKYCMTLQIIYSTHYNTLIKLGWKTGEIISFHNKLILIDFSISPCPNVSIICHPTNYTWIMAPQGDQLAHYLSIISPHNKKGYIESECLVVYQNGLYVQDISTIRLPPILVL